MNEPSIPLSQFALEMGLAYRPALDLVLKGAVKGHKTPGGRWRVLRADADRLIRQRALEHAVASGQPTELASQIGQGLYETLAKMHQVGKGMAALQMQYDSHLESLEADAAEAEQQGNNERAEELRAIAEDMRRATYGFDHATGKFVLGMKQPDGSVLLAKREQPA